MCQQRLRLVVNTRYWWKRL